MRNIIIILLLLIHMASQAQNPVDPYLELAASNNPMLKAKFNDFMASLETIPQARGLTDPKLAFGYFIQPVETRVGAQRASIGITQTFPWFGTLKAKEDVACQVAEAKLISFQEAKLKLYKEVRVAYSELYYLKRAVRLTEENLLVLRSFKELARVNFESGKTGFVSVLRVEMEEKELEAKLAQLRDSQRSALIDFENLINVSLDQPIFLPDSLESVKLDYQTSTLFDSLEAKNLQLKELSYLSDAKKEEMEVARMMSLPALSVGVNYIFVDDRTDMDVPDNGKNAFLFPQIGMSIPIFQKKYQAMQNQANLQHERIQYQIEDKSNQLSSQLEFLIRDYTDGRRRKELYLNLHDLAEISLSLIQTEFTTGKTNFEEVLRMERKLLTYQLAMERARVDINNAVYKINYLLGNEKIKY